MMDIICVMPTVASSDSNIAASIVGALIGALLGALSAFLLSEYARKREIERQKVQKMKDNATEDAASLKYIQKYTVSIISQSLMNSHSAKDLSRGIISEEGKYAFSLTTPTVYPTAREANGFINQQLFLYWEDFGREIYSQNQSIKSMTEYYNWLRQMSRQHLFSEESSAINQKAIEGDDALIVGAMKSVHAASEALYDKAISVMACIHCYVDHRNETDIRDVDSLGAMRKIIEGFEGYEPTKKEFEAKKKKLKSIYSPEAMFQAEAY